MTDKLELKSCHEVIDTVDVANVESIFYGKPTDPDILTVVMKDGKSLYCDEVCPVDSLQEEPKFKTGDRIKPIDSCLGYPRTIVDVCDSWYVTDQGTLDFEFEDNWELAEEPVSKTPADIEAAMQEVEEKSRAFTEAHKGKTSEEILAEMRGEEPVSDDLESEIQRYYVDWDEHPEYVQTARHFTKWQKEHLWKPADGDDLPEYEREVVAFQEIFPTDVDVPSLLKIVIAHRPNPDGWDGKNLATNEVTHYTPKLYDKGGWNVPDIAYWLDVRLPKEIEL